MGVKNISPDGIILWEWGWVHINATLIYTWLTMALLVLIAWGVGRRLSFEPPISRWQHLLEILVKGIQDQIADISHQDPGRYTLFIGSLFLFLFFSNLLAVVPFYQSPAASLSTTAGLSICVFIAVPVWGIRQQGVLGYLKNYIQPTVFMLPFNIMGELSRTLALAVRLFGNVMSSAKIVAILLTLVPLFFPVLMQALGLLTGLIHAYIFAVLAMVYIASASQASQESREKAASNGQL